MSETQKLPEFTSNDVALAAGKQVIAAAVEMAVQVIDDSEDPNVRADLESEFHDKLLESGVPVVVPALEGSNYENIHQRKGHRTSRTRDEVIIDTTRIFWARKRGMLPRPKKLS